MQLLPTTHRRRNGNAISCTTCGKLITPKQASRRQRYCSYSCRDEARRQRNFANFACTRTTAKAIPRSAQKSSTNSADCVAHFGGRAFPTKAPLNLLGGYSWPNAAPVDPKLLARIIRSEIGDRVVKPPQPTTAAIEPGTPAPERRTLFADAVGLDQQGGQP
jgi:hypothetical protein